VIEELDDAPRTAADDAIAQARAARSHVRTVFASSE
jgi:hypothetical protein